MKVKMNIFFLDHSPEVAASYHCDVHVVKMILETAQILSTTHRLLGNVSADSLLYKATHASHPCTVWARKSVANYKWLYELMLCLNDEYKRRYNHVEDHMSVCKLGEMLAYPPVGMVLGAFTSPPQCMPEEFMCKDVVEAYRKYYRGAKAGIAKWKSGNVPAWMVVS